MTRPLLIAATIVAAVSGAALASDRDGSIRVDAPRSEWMSVSALAQKFEAQGYVIREIEIDDGVYELSGTDANGMRVEAYVHPVTGEVLSRGKDD